MKAGVQCISGKLPLLTDKAKYFIKWFELLFVFIGVPLLYYYDLIPFHKSNSVANHFHCCFSNSSY
jgi:hypothetical protein